MKIILLSFLFISLFASGAKEFKTDKVYICVSSSSYAYHNDKNCRWLKNCTHIIKEVTEEEAISVYKREKCKPCYGATK
jgi:hypothetical protein